MFEIGFSNTLWHIGYRKIKTEEGGTKKRMDENFKGQEQMAQDATSAAGTFAGQVQVEEKPVNMVTGIVGAFGGVLIGVVLWILIYQMGFIAGIAGFVMMICAFKGFELLGGRINLAGAVICVILVLVAVYFAHNIAIAISVMQELDTSFSSAYQSLSVLRDEVSEFNSAYLHDLLIGYVLTLVAIVPSIKGKVRR